MAWEKLKETRSARFLIKNGISFSRIKGEREKAKAIKQMRELGRIDKNDTISVRNGNGAKMILRKYKTDVVQKEIVLSDDYYEGDWLDRVFSSTYLKDYVNKKTALDIGANIGSHTLYFIKELDMKLVYSFEPIKSIYDELVTNIQVNNWDFKCRPINCGIGDHDCSVCIEKKVKNNAGATKLSKVSMGDIPIKTVDYFNIDDIALVKIDTEGYEVEVLNGAKKTMDKCRPIVLVEIDKRNMEKVKTIMSMCRYTLYLNSMDNYVYLPEEIFDRLS